MNATQLIDLIEVAVARKTGACLNHLQKVILQECCCNKPKTYEQIALELSYSPGYLKKKVIPSLWKMLSEVFGEKVTKANCRSVLEKNIVAWENPKPNKAILERPDGPVPLGSPFYVRRDRLERRGCEELLEPGALLCLQGPSKVGKTSLLVRLLDNVEKNGCRAVRLSLNRASTSVLSSTNKLARWLCANIARQLNVEARPNKFWHDEAGDLTNCSLYLKEQFLSRSSVPIVVALDEFDRLFAHPTIARDFLSLLRSLYEEAKDCSLWQKLRIVLVCSTEAYVWLDTYKSPIDMGLTLEVPPLNALQVRELAGFHPLHLTASELDRLHALLGGFPDLIRQVFYHMASGDLDRPELLSSLATDTGILSDRLHEKLHWLKTYPDLLAAYRQIVSSETPQTLEPQIAFQLQSLGLVRRHENGVTISCELYRQYFQERL